MITKITCDRFKGLDGQGFNLKRLSVLSGTNCSGKSSIIQAILLARLACQLSKENDGASVNVPLNGPFDLRLGAVYDVKSFGSSSDAPMRVIMNDDSIESCWEFISTSPADRYLECRLPQSFPPSLTTTAPGGFTYLSALRDDQADFQHVQSVPKSMVDMGCRGQHVADVLEAFASHAVQPPLRHPQAGAMPLPKQVEHWLSEFVPAVQLRVDMTKNMDVVSLRYLQGEGLGEWVRPSNTGFGLSYCLPIVVAGLLGKPGSLLIIDSPEAHLHPAAQSAMGQFLARLAAHGIQVIIETHSDHIINGIRLAAVDPAHPFQREDAIFHFLKRGEEGPIAREITITQSGALSEYPELFFDQSEIDLARILTARKEAR